MADIDKKTHKRRRPPPPLLTDSIRFSPGSSPSEIKDPALNQDFEDLNKDARSKAYHDDEVEEHPKKKEKRKKRKKEIDISENDNEKQFENVQNYNQSENEVNLNVVMPRRRKSKTEKIEQNNSISDNRKRSSQNGIESFSIPMSKSKTDDEADESSENSTHSYKKRKERPEFRTEKIASDSIKAKKEEKRRKKENSDEERDSSEINRSSKRRKSRFDEDSPDYIESQKKYFELPHKEQSYSDENMDLRDDISVATVLHEIIEEPLFALVKRPEPFFDEGDHDPIFEKLKKHFAKTKITSSPPRPAPSQNTRDTHKIKRRPPPPI